MQTCNQGSKDDITIRSALKTDADVALRLFQEDLKALSSTERLDDGDLRNLNDTYLDDADSGFWIAEYKGDVVGMIGVRAGADHTAEICRLRVQKDHRRRGIGTLLLEQAVTHCRDHGLLPSTEMNFRKPTDSLSPSVAAVRAGTDTRTIDPS